MRWDELVNLGELRLPGPLSRHDAALDRALGRRPGWRLRRAVSPLQPLVWLAGGTPPSRIGYGPGFLQDRRDRRQRPLRRQVRIALLEEHRRGTRFGHALASFINERSRACTAVVNDTAGADLAWVFTQDPIEPGARARLERMIAAFPERARVLNPLADHDAYLADDCFDRLRAAGVGVPRTAFQAADLGVTEVVDKAVDQQPSAKSRSAYRGPVPGHRAFAFVDARGANGRSRRYRAFFVAGMVWTGDVTLSGDWKASLDTLAAVRPRRGRRRHGAGARQARPLPHGARAADLGSTEGGDLGTLQWVGFLVGVVLVLGTSLSVFRTLVVPRRVNSTIGNAVERSVRLVAVWVTLTLPMMVAGSARQHNARAHYERADRVLAITGPLSLLALLSVWQLSFILGYALMLWPINAGTFAGALRESGSSFFTLGFTATDTPPATVVIFFCAATGLISVALLIGYLPTLYGAFNRREKLITTLEARAGVPAWGPEILVRQALVGLLDSLPGLYDDWEEWAADLSETHSNYPILVRFRSPSPYRSWIVGLIAVLDSAALYLAFCPERAPIQARLVLRQGFSALRDIATAVRLTVVDDPHPEDPISVTYEQFLDGVERMSAVGFPMERTPEEAWPHYRGWRVNYDPIAVEIADLIDAAPAPWSGRRTHFPEPIAPRRPRDRRPEDPEGIGTRAFTATAFQQASEAHERVEAERNGQRAADRAARGGRRAQPPADGPPAPADGPPAPADGTPAPADGLPAPADGLPAPADGLPAPQDAGIDET